MTTKIIRLLFFFLYTMRQIYDTGSGCDGLKLSLYSVLKMIMKPLSYCPTAVQHASQIF